MPSLLPCPFCSGKAEIETIEKDCFGIGCPNCDFQLMNGPWAIGWHRSKHNAATEWNRRTEFKKAVPVAGYDWLSRRRFRQLGCSSIHSSISIRALNCISMERVSMLLLSLRAWCLNMGGLRLHPGPSFRSKVSSQTQCVGVSCSAM
ncbi:Lar family restriction alleviation protein [Paraburkholderia sp. DGU8]|uniref:Lar family restriction alleviation protein n=1 Tax=Paraburkholderia sp. DGU8 TaxID=3161997 RepID=UPI00346720B9